MSPTAVPPAEVPRTPDSLSIEFIRRKLASETVGRHLYLFGREASTVEILRRLADAGAPEGSVVLSDDGTDVRLSVLFRPDRPLQATGALADLAAQALADATWLERLPAALTVEGPTVAHRTEWLGVSIDVKFGAVSQTPSCEIDRNAFTATFLNLLDRSFASWMTRGRGTGVAAGECAPGGTHAGG